jgi:uncharacterized protein YcfL
MMRYIKWALWVFSALLLLAGCSSGDSTTRQISDGVVIEKGKPTLLFFYTDN